MQEAEEPLRKINRTSRITYCHTLYKDGSVRNIISVKLRCVNGEHGGESVQCLLVDDGHFPICIGRAVGGRRVLVRRLVTVAVVCPALKRQEVYEYPIYKVAG